MGAQPGFSIGHRARSANFSYQIRNLDKPDPWARRWISVASFTVNEARTSKESFASISTMWPMTGPGPISCWLERGNGDSDQRWGLCRYPQFADSNPDVSTVTLGDRGRPNSFFWSGGYSKFAGVVPAHHVQLNVRSRCSVQSANLKLEIWNWLGSWNYTEFGFSEPERRVFSSRCMHCRLPKNSNSRSCPLGDRIPEGGF